MRTKPEPIDLRVCSLCKLSWIEHTILARTEMVMDYYDNNGEDAVSPEELLPTDPRSPYHHAVTVKPRHCVQLLLVAQRGPSGPPGPTGPMGVSGPAAPPCSCQARY